MSASPSPSPSPTRTARAVPDVAGKIFTDARTALSNQGFYATTIVGKDGSKWSNVVPDKTVTVVSTKPAAGTSTTVQDVEVTVSMTQVEFVAATKAAADAAKLAARYQYLCGSNPYGTTGTVKFKSFKEVWTSPHYAAADKCIVKVDGKSASDDYTLIPSEQATVDLVAANGGDVSVPSYALDTVLNLCTKLDPDYADLVHARPDWRKASAKAALALCPDAPHAAILQEVLTAVKISDGNHIVGGDMQPGTYRTKAGISDCYWSRNTGGGNIIANDFVGFAPNGVTVTVRAGEGFESSRCGTWTKIG
ncbi:MAG TPA: PASTA domain-containing protein [Arthrobacter sp.]